MSNKDHDDILLQKLVKTYFKTNRNKVNLSQEELNELSKISVETISKIETGKSIPELKSFFNLIIALNIDANEIIAEYEANSEFFNRK